MRKLKVGKMAIVGPKTWVKPFGKNVNFSTFSTSCIYSLERRFNVLEYRKTHFPWPILREKKNGKIAIFGAKPLVNQFVKMSIFRLFEQFVFMA